MHGSEKAQGACFGLAHGALLRGHPIVVAREMKPAVHKVEGKFDAERAGS